ncbi:DNA mismatch repair protein MutH [Enterobacteriaceae endosymbiont of Plateumaris consimilis]|uniref:MutH/Sau3AI family endonuclease n=1 Tax=Enterobacteriaceae endosymbiont of Plateumaris consimilis TaxID=2675794 RepID=UPI00144A2AF2|nr:MutH/Sau3AI family endonuclease [Enterobacteriaceae endosymbiont of Plateumaris consimilis]QJC28814.1 DNA mismatch repair protein MutH [Enterobacteriaceae endosymbiont of Plateumaris consimilis]
MYIKKIFSNNIINEKILFFRATLMTGHCLNDIAEWLNFKIPTNLNKDKGWIGKLIELYLLGKQQKNRFNQDIPQIGIEIKTIPIDVKGNTINNTFICYLPLTNKNFLIWKESTLYSKLLKILWIPIITKNKNIPFEMRVIGKPIIWKPSKKNYKNLYNDWIELMKLLISGKIECINHYNGTILLVKTKSNKNKLIKTINQNNEIILTSPRAFYLKKKFTKTLFINS